MTHPLEALLREKILLLDGAMGTMIQRARLAEEDYRGARFRDWPRELRGNNDLLSLTQPRLVRDIHAQYLQAGADVIETNTFNSTSIALADYGMESLAREFNRAAAALARDAVRDWGSKTPHQPRFVAGVLGPTNKTASISPDVNDPGFRAVSFDELVAAYAEAMQGSGLFDSYDDVRGLARLAEIEKVLYELRYELDNRPAWLHIPLQGLAALIEKPEGG